MYIERWLKAGILQKDGTTINRLTGTPQGGVVSPLLSNIFLHVAFDEWMDKYHPDKLFEKILSQGYIWKVILEPALKRLYLAHKINWNEGFWTN